ncbi:hypothetical protein VdG1_00948 [Verticillium dahliae VDG1]|nr:hypothetical protein VdG1_00948 [Verticillium dahliae VDG1]
MALTVHHLVGSQSERVIWLCEELGIDYELKKYERSPILAPAELKAKHPLGAAPIIIDGDVTLAESGACIEYICQTYGKGKFIVTPRQETYADYLYWFHFANGTLQPTLMCNLSLKLSGLSDNNGVMKSQLQKQKQLLEFMDERLSKVPYLAGSELTAADIMTFVCFTSMRCFFPYDLSGYDNILSYTRRVAQRDGYRRAMQKGDADADIEQLIGPDPPPMQKGLAAAIRGMGS